MQLHSVLLATLACHLMRACLSGPQPPLQCQAAAAAVQLILLPPSTTVSSTSHQALLINQRVEQSQAVQALQPPQQEPATQSSPVLESTQPPALPSTGHPAPAPHQLPATTAEGRPLPGNLPTWSGPKCSSYQRQSLAALTALLHHSAACTPAAAAAAGSARTPGSTHSATCSCRWSERQLICANSLPSIFIPAIRLKALESLLQPAPPSEQGLCVSCEVSFEQLLTLACGVL
jgi:hypothetical protein